ncbi:MAG: hypothetical protein P4L45_00505 [Ignavibacteriaceae bacterium]|nr:hypothetical protein [Ignavibacteriaceae bacterium]
MTKKSEQVVKDFLKLSPSEQSEVLKKLSNLQFSSKIKTALSIQKIKRTAKLTFPDSKTNSTNILNKRTTHGIVLGPLDAVEPLSPKIESSPLNLSKSITAAKKVSKRKIILGPLDDL